MKAASSGVVSGRLGKTGVVESAEVIQSKSEKLFKFLLAVFFGRGPSVQGARSRSSLSPRLIGRLINMSQARAKRWSSQAERSANRLAKSSDSSMKKKIPKEAAFIRKHWPTKGGAERIARAEQAWKEAM